MSGGERDASWRVTLPWTVRRVTSDETIMEEVRVVMEEPLIIEVNGQQVAALMRLPGDEKELAVGFCVSEGLITDVDAVQLVHHCGSGLPAPDEDPDLEMTSRNRVQIQARADALRQDVQREVLRLVRSGCGAAQVQSGDLDLPPVASTATVSAALLLSLNATLRQGQELFRDVGAVHAAALFAADGALVAIREDIGRHNAVDKVLGYCLLRRIPLHDKIILTTGRASYEMVSKAVRVGLPFVASVSSPTALAVQLADAYRCTLIGYMRANRFSIYTHGWRVSDA